MLRELIATTDCTQVVLQSGRVVKDIVKTLPKLDNGPPSPPLPNMRAGLSVRFL